MGFSFLSFSNLMIIIIANEINETLSRILDNINPIDTKIRSIIHPDQLRGVTIDRSIDSIIFTSDWLRNPRINEILYQLSMSIEPF
jgi:hypothetical protein